MIPNKQEIPLTPAANDMLDKLTNEYRNEILAKAKEFASYDSLEPKEISLHNLSSAISNDKRVINKRKLSTFEIGLRTYLIIGLLFCIIGIVYLLFIHFISELPSEEQTGFIIIIIGLGLSAASYGLLRSRLLFSGSHNKKPLTVPEYEVEFNYKLISKWQEIEIALRNYYYKLIGEPVENEPVSILISNLQKNEEFSKDDIDRIKEILMLRNKIVHNGHLISSEQLSDVEEYTNKLLKKLR